MTAQSPVAASHQTEEVGHPGDERLLTLDDAKIDELPAKLQWSLIGYFRAVGAFQHAEQSLAIVERRGGESVRLLEERARLSFAMNRFADARSYLQRRIEVAPSASAQIALARFYLETGDVEAAEAITQRLIRTNNELVTVVTLAADVAAAMGDADVARDYYLGAVDARPEHAGALLSLAQLALDEGDDPTASEFFRRAMNNLGDNASAPQCMKAAEIAELLGDHARAAELHSRASQSESERTAALVSEILGSVSDAPPAFHEINDPSTFPSPQKSSASNPAAEPFPAAAAWEAPPSDLDLDPRVLAMLNRDFGHAALRPGQAAVIQHVLADRDTLAIMPTGAGKSLTFQLPAMLQDGTTLVISPLIALMKDQVESLPSPVRDKTALINSTLSSGEMRSRLDDLRAGRLRLVYVAPERLRDHMFLRALRETGVSLVVIDEAHCISMWGHDFRPDYLFIPKALPELGDPPILAITATATPGMAKQIGRGLGRDLALLRVSVFRPNLNYEVFLPENREKKVAKVIEICRRETGNGIVYVGSRKDAESIAALLRDNRVNAIPYHAGLAAEIRAQNQERFMSGQVRVVVATVAFGMGVDKADVRFIVHLGPPSSLEAYAQESGRAGRDGEQSRCVLLASPTDESNLKRMARRDEIDLDALRRVYAMIKRSANGDWAIINRDALLPTETADGEEEIDPRIALGVLDQAGLLVRHPNAPATYDLRWKSHLDVETPTASSSADDALLERLTQILGPDVVRHPSILIRTADICTALGLTPVELDRVLNSQPNLFAREGARGVCLQLLPVSGNATENLSAILDRAKVDAERRIRQVMTYVRGNRCRHVMLAEHLGEQIEPCGSSCDVCLHTAPAAKTRSTRVSDSEETPTRTLISAQDAFNVLEGVRTLPFPMGKTGLVKLLTGSVESRVRQDRAPGFGLLAGLSRGKVDGLIDRLVTEGYLDRDLDHEFKLISLTRKGADATVDNLASFGTASSNRPGSASSTTVSDADLDDDDRYLLDVLTAWRRDKAAEESVPAYIIAPNSALKNLAITRPKTTSMLAAVPGFGPVKVEKYGTELIRLIARSAGSTSK